MSRRLMAIIVAVIITCALASVAVAADDPFVGTWKLNPAKSKFDPGPAPKGQTLKVDVQDNGFRWTFDTVGADGKAMHMEWLGKYDGKDYSQAGNKDADTVATRRIDAHTLDSVLRNGGKNIGTGRCIVSKDGKSMTLIENRPPAGGQYMKDVLFYDKQ